MNHISQAFYAAPWALHPPKLREVEAVVRSRFFVQRGAGRPKRIKLRGEAEARQPGEGRGGKPYYMAGRVAVIPVMGVIAHRINVLHDISGGTSTQLLGRTVEQAAADAEVGTIVLDIDSPGGSVFGVPEMAATLRQARQAKRIVAVANTFAASAAYWLASQASEIVVSPSGQVGSIGVYSAHYDCSVAMEMAGVKTTYIYAGKYKVEGNPDEPLSEEAASAWQREVDTYYTMFVDDVARGRGANPDAVRAGYGEARCLCAADAIAARLADRIGTLEQVVEEEKGRQDGGFAALRARQRQLELAS
jgi:signal peptide peptidase SppA